MPIEGKSDRNKILTRVEIQGVGSAYGSKGLVINYEEGGGDYKTGGGGGASEVLPSRKEGGGGKSFSHANGEAQNVLG